MNDSIDQGHPFESYSKKESLIDQPQSEKQIEIPEELKNSKQYQSEQVPSDKDYTSKNTKKSKDSINKNMEMKFDEKMFLYDSKTPSEEIYRNISDLTMHQKEYLNYRKESKNKKSSNLTEKIEEETPRLFKKQKQGEEKWSINAYKEDTKMNKDQLMQKMQQSLKSAEEFSKKSFKAESIHNDSGDLLSNFSLSQSENSLKNQNLTNKRKTTFNNHNSSNTRYI